MENTQNRVVLFPRNMRLIRKKWGLTQIQFGEIFNVSDASINQYESKRSEPRIWVIIELQMMTGINAQDLYYSEITREMIPSEPLYNNESIAEPISISTKPNDEYGAVSRTEFKVLEARVIALENKK